MQLKLLLFELLFLLHIELLQHQHVELRLTRRFPGDDHRARWPGTT
nr:hypothetical protein [Micromonospora sp. DSM 115978]